MISTKNLYLLEIATVKYIDWRENSTRKLYFSDEKRYILANKKSDTSDYYKDVFTNTVYKRWDRIITVGEEAIVHSKSAITSKKFITKEEGILLLQELNPTYLPETPKMKRKKEKHNK